MGGVPISGGDHRSDSHSSSSSRTSSETSLAELFKNATRSTAVVAVIVALVVVVAPALAVGFVSVAVHADVDVAVSSTEITGVVVVRPPSGKPEEEPKEKETNTTLVTFVAEARPGVAAEAWGYLRRSRAVETPFIPVGPLPQKLLLREGDYEFAALYAPSFADPARPSVEGWPLLAEREARKVEGTTAEVRFVLNHCGVAGNALRGDPPDSFFEPMTRLRVRRTAGAVITAMPEPVIRHGAEHRDCRLDFAEPVRVPRVWSVEQLKRVSAWISSLAQNGGLPTSAAEARTNVDGIVDRVERGWPGAGTFLVYVGAGLLIGYFALVGVLEADKSRRWFSMTVAIIGLMGVAGSIVMGMYGVLWML